MFLFIKSPPLPPAHLDPSLLVASKLGLRHLGASRGCVGWSLCSVCGYTSRSRKKNMIVLISVGFSLFPT